MGYKPKKGKTKTTCPAKFGGKKKIIDAETGETIDVQVINHKATMDTNFHKIWLGHIFEVLDIGNKKMSVVTYLLDQMNNQNMIVKTQREIAEGSDTSLSTVQRTLEALEEAEFIYKKIGIVMINPDVIYKGGHDGRMYVLHVWNKMHEGNDDDENKKEKSDE